MSDACVAQWSEQSTDSRKTWARIPAQSKASFFHRNIFKFLKYFDKYFDKYSEISLKYEIH